MRNLNDDPGAVARVDLASAGAAMLQVQQNLQRFVDQVVRLAILEIGNETHAAGVMFVRRIDRAPVAGERCASCYRAFLAFRRAPLRPWCSVLAEKLLID